MGSPRRRHTLQPSGFSSRFRLLFPKAPSVTLEFPQSKFLEENGKLKSSVNAADIALEFVRRINAHSPERLAELMMEEHTFIDSTGTRFEGSERMQENWTAYFAIFPDYHLTVESSIDCDDVAVLFGTAFGTYAVDGQLLEENRWSTPIAIRAAVESEKLREWRVYADNHAVFEIIARHRG